ncbi:MAG: hypoxanthine phosphoribosyltransferase [Acidobacteriota bacterium]
MISSQRLQERIRELAADIDRDYAEMGCQQLASPGGAPQLVVLGVLKGSVFFLVDLTKHLQIPVAVDFFQTASYGAGTEPGEVRIRKDIDLSVRGKHVLLVEDIVDTGYTLRTILDLLRFRRAASVRLCSLLDKESRREVDVEIHYRGFAIEDRFVVGYGLDYDEKYRNLPYIGVLPSPGQDAEENP